MTGKVNSALPEILVFFSYGNSLQTWVETGLIKRELLLYKKMIKEGYRITLLTYGDEADDQYHEDLQGINIIPIYKYVKKYGNRWTNLVQSFFIPFNSRLKKAFQNADIFKTNQMVGAWVPLIAKVLYGKPLIVRCGYEMLRNLLRDETRKIKWCFKAVLGYLFEFWAYMAADRIIISNRSDQTYIYKKFPVRKEKFRLIRNFIDTEKFTSKTAFAKPTEKKKKILYIGRIEHRKNIENLIKGAAAAGVPLDIIGKGENQSYFERLAEDKDVTFLGVIDNNLLPDIINQYNLFVLLSFYENNPKTLLEAMACGQVVLGTDVEGIRELIKDGQTGFLCKTDSNAIRTSITKTLELPDETVNKISLNARQFIVDTCAIERVFSQETKIYAELIS